MRPERDATSLIRMVDRDLLRIGALAAGGSATAQVASALMLPDEGDKAGETVAAVARSTETARPSRSNRATSCSACGPCARRHAPPCRSRPRSLRDGSTIKGRTHRCIGTR